MNINPRLFESSCGITGTISHYAPEKPLILLANHFRTTQSCQPKNKIFYDFEKFFQDNGIEYKYHTSYSCKHNGVNFRINVYRNKKSEGEYEIEYQKISGDKSSHEEIYTKIKDHFTKTD
jgi:hypothetical protein